MTIRITRVLSLLEYRAMNREARAAGYYHGDPRIFTPGMAWFQPWYFDPLGEMAELKKTEAEIEVYQMVKSREHDQAKGRSFLSPHYWADWSTKRAPICVVCPNGEQWEIDRRSSNGDGWKVIGELPTITCNPSIAADGYHGYLQNGVFTADVDGRPPNGIARALREPTPPDPTT